MQNQTTIEPLSVFSSHNFVTSCNQEKARFAPFLLPMIKKQTKSKNNRGQIEAHIILLLSVCD